MANLMHVDEARAPASPLTRADVEALERAVSSMGNWKAVLVAQREPTAAYDEALTKARAAAYKLRTYVEQNHG